MGAGASRGSFADATREEAFPGVHRAAFSSLHSTVTSYVFDPGASFPMHSHPQEQILLVQEGDVTFTVAGDPLALAPGDWAVVEPEIEHGLTAGEQGARIVAVVTPKRSAPDEYAISA
jgi:quercetin dioxygenase-like cupin family protein